MNAIIISILITEKEKRSNIDIELIQLCQHSTLEYANYLEISLIHMIHECIYNHKIHIK